MINRTILLKQINEKFYKNFAYILQILSKYRGIIIDVDTYIINDKKSKKKSYIYEKCIYLSIFT